ncbi:MAG: transposase [Thermodesulfobacteriota bacterium]
MAQSLAKILLHVVFSTKNREPRIPPSLQPRLHAYLAEACRSVGSQAYRVGGTEDHVHIACSLPRTMAPSDLVLGIKTASSAWMKGQDDGCVQFAWQGGYGAFSLGQSQLPGLLHYIGNQQEHHRTRLFRDEILEILKRDEVQHHEEHLWD